MNLTLKTTRTDPLYKRNGSRGSQMQRSPVVAERVSAGSIFCRHRLAARKSGLRPGKIRR